jgi:hypothetical protein
MTADSPTMPSRATGHTAARVAAAVLGALVAAIIPALVGLVLLGSAAIRRPMLGRRIGTPADGASGPAATQRGRTATRLTLVWGTGLLVIGLIQGVMALTTGVSLADPKGMLTRTLIALAGEALLALWTLAWLRRPRTGRGAR